MVLEVAGWALVLLGIAALVLPGPGLLLLFAGLALLSQQYEWAEKRVDPVKDRALEGAKDSVRTWPRLAFSIFGVAWLLGFGVLWCLGPDAPTWWPVDDDWWLRGGIGVGSSLIISGLAVAGLLVYSWRMVRRER